jgi:carbon-monoxide dehydrogenase iron sulfur subunit
MSKKLVIRLDVCSECLTCTAKCSYPYHPGNDGVARLRELAAQELTCRRCERRSCVDACPSEALEARDDGFLRRHTLRCTACLSCAHACPFGNILPVAFQFRGSLCDFCASPRRHAGLPECVRTCPLGALAFEEVPEEEPDAYRVGDSLVIRSKVWQKIEPVAKR